MRRLGSVFRRKRPDELPSGTLTFLLTDIEGSTRLWEVEPDGMERAVPRHIELIQLAVDSGDGILVRERGEGDSTFSVFTDAKGAVRAALSAQRALQAEAWPDGVDIRVRFALHTGDATFADGEYTAPDINRCARIRALAAGGQTLLSDRTAELVRDALPADATLEDLGTHRLRDLSRPERISQLNHPELQAAFPALRSLDVTPHNLPIQLTSFIGRDEELNRVKKFVQTTRMLTLTGTGGLGKTRLALQAGAESVEQFSDGVWFVDLAPVADHSLVAGAATSALSLRDEAGRTTIETLVAHLAERHTLLIFDNCEQVVAGVTELANALLRACPEVSILATSRATLNVTGATSWSVPPMELPSGDEVSPEALQSYESVRLFCERAGLRNPNFALTHDNAPDVLEICRRLDGIPLAVELAAAQTNVLSPSEIARRLEDRFKLLTGGPDDDPRHATLRATLDWSYELLGPRERLLLGRLSVFAGGFALDAVEDVCSGDGLERGDVLDVLRELVVSSLVLPVEAPDEVRFGMLETIREYATEHRAASNDSHPTERRHLEWAAHLLEAAWRSDSADEALVLNQLQREHDNIRGALSRSIEIDPSIGATLAARVHPFWFSRGYWTESRSTMERFLGLVAEGSKPWAEVTTEIGVLAQAQGDIATGKAYLERALPAWRRLDDPPRLARCLLSLGTASMHLGDRAAALTAIEEAQAIAEEAGDEEALTDALHNLGVDAARTGDYTRAVEIFERIVATARRGGGRYTLVRPLFNLGMCRLSLGDTDAAESVFQETRAIADELGNREVEAACLSALAGVAEDRLALDRAESMYQDALEIQRGLDDPMGQANSLLRLADLGRHRGDLEGARALVDRSLELWRGTGHLDGTAGALITLAGISRAAGQAEEALAASAEALSISANADRKRAVALGLEVMAGILVDRSDAEMSATLFGAAQAVREQIGVEVAPADRTGYERDLERVAGLLGSRAAEALARGRAMPLDEAVALATAQNSR